MNLIKFLSIVVLFLCSFTLSGCAGLLVAGASTGAVLNNDARSAGTLLDDDNIESRFKSRFRDREDIYTQSSVDAVSYNKVVLLVGQTPNRGYKDDLGKIAADVPNVRRVYNEVRVAPPRSSFDGAADATITSKVKTSLITEKGFPSGRVKVVTEARVVYLFGLVNAQQAAIASELARHIDGVNKVVQLFEIIES